MCGIYFFYSKNNIEIIKNNINNIIEKLLYRGPDYTNKYIYNNQLLMVHTLLAINGFNPQPYHTDNGYILFNGEIYSTNDMILSTQTGILEYNDILSTYENEGVFLQDFFEKNDGLKKLHLLDGEYTINYIDIKNGLIHFITDPFFTKPYCYYINKEYFIGSTYLSCILNTLKLLNLTNTNNIIHLEPNTHYIFDLNRYTLIEQKHIINWDFNPRYSSFDRWNIAFENSIKKRTNTKKNIFIPLSSGYDSGCIVSSLIKLNKSFQTYTFKGKEDLEILNKRKKIIEETNNDFFFINPKDDIEHNYIEYCKRIENYIAYHFDGTPYSDIYDAYSCFGIYQIFKNARNSNRIIFLSGHGGDEIFSDYGNETNISCSILKLDYKNVRSKWPNFDSGYGRNILQMFERVSGCFGIESRYPFLDKQVVQEFLWLSDYLKNKEFKQCIGQYMKLNRFPYSINNKCSVRIITDDEGGNDFFFKLVKKIKKKLNIENNIYPKYYSKNYTHLRPNLDYKPKISYYP